MTDVTARVDALADALAAAGYLNDDRWRDALHAVPRHLFVPAVAWAADENGGYPIDRDTDPDTWMDAAYANHPIIIQLDDGATDITTGAGDYTSSLSAPDVVFDFLEKLDVYDGDRILEIGTGSGWTPALLSQRVGSGNVTTVEVDADVSAGAAAGLKEAGYSPRLVVGDGGDGWPAGAPFDRVHVTCGVTTVPYPWVEQTRPGGVIVLPWMPEYAGGHKLRLTVLPDGTAVGRFVGDYGYMMMRSQRPTGARIADIDDYRDSVPTVDPRRIVRAGRGADMAIAGMLPDVGTVRSESDGEFELRLLTSDSKAVVTWGPDRAEVRQWGPRNLWDELTAAFFTWVSFGQPARDRFGLTVTPAGQHVWLDSPDHVLSLGA